MAEKSKPGLVALAAGGTVSALVGPAVATSLGPLWVWVGALGGLIAAVAVVLVYRARTHRMLEVLDRRHHALLVRLDAAEHGVIRVEEATIPAISQAVEGLEERVDSGMLGLETLRSEAAHMREINESAVGDLVAQIRSGLADVERSSSAQFGEARAQFEEVRAEVEEVRAKVEEVRAEVEEVRAEVENRIAAASEATVARLSAAQAVADGQLTALGDSLQAKQAELASRHRLLFDSVARFRETYQGARAELRTSQRALQEELSIARQQAQELDSQIVGLALSQALGLPASSIVDAAQHRNLLRRALKADLQAPPYDLALGLASQAPELMEDLGLGDLRTLAVNARGVGLLQLATTAQEIVAERSGRESDVRALRLWGDELRVDSMDFWELVPEGVEPLGEPTDVVLHLVGKALPETQSGYTVRTHETVKAQVALGLHPVVAVQGGVGRADVDQRYELDGVLHVTLQAPARNGVPRTDWLRANIDSLLQLCRELRPRVIHAHSDYLNAMMAEVAGKALGVPVVYEQRGFWEESWWSRIVGDNHVRSDLFSRLMMPEVYTGRQRQEAQARAKATRLVTLADVMVEHAMEQNAGFGLGMAPVDVVQNAVDANRFAQVERKQELADELGITGPVIGYISSMVPYEGIDVLVAGFRQLRDFLRAVPDMTDAGLSQTLAREWGCGEEACAGATQQLRRLATGPEPELLLVGDGIAVQRLDASVRSDPGVHLVGRVPNEIILDYYGLIDVFVVPRKPYVVSEIVTPLKPYEAMAAARAIIMSDVQALRAIAEQSQAALLFTAGDAGSLAAQIARLLSDAELRSELGRRGQDWVRETRTWSGNAARYVSVYAKAQDSTAMLPGLSLRDVAARLDAARVDLGELAAAFGSSPEPTGNGWFSTSPEPTGNGWFFTSPSRVSAEDVIREGWRSSASGLIPLTDIDWEDACAGNRSDAFMLQGWELLQPLMSGFSGSKDPRLLDAALGVAEDWSAYYGDGEPAGSMAFYDMSLALRIARLSRLVDWGFRFGQQDRAVKLLRLLILQVERLGDDESFNARNNHGFYAAVADLEFAKRFRGILPTSESLKRGTERLRLMVDSQFASDGGHKEHSPAYHRMLLSSFNAARAEGLIDDEQVLERLARADYALGWFSMPDGTLAQFGDTEAVQVAPADMGELGASSTDFLLSQGVRGAPDNVEVYALPEAGYAFVRSPQPHSAKEFAQHNYLALSACFHSRTHKHADDLTVVWAHKGKEVLVDSGRFGYLDLLPPDSPDRLNGFYYSRPERQYVESTRAHNTVEVDGRDIDRRTRAPYGSGITEATQLGDGTFSLAAEAPHGTYKHRRRLLFNPGRSLVFEDELIFGAEHEQVTVWFNLAGELDVEESAGHLDVIIPGTGEILRITSSADSYDLTRGQKSPLRGWRSRRDRTLEPAWSLALRVPVEEGRCHVTTEFRVIDKDGK